MAKPLSDKSKKIREAIEAHADLNHHQLAALLVEQGVKCTANDVYRQRQTAKAVHVEEVAPPVVASKQCGPAEALERLVALADAVGGMQELRRMMDVLNGQAR